MSAGLRSQSFLAMVAAEHQVVAMDTRSLRLERSPCDEDVQLDGACRREMSHVWDL